MIALGVWATSDGFRRFRVISSVYVCKDGVENGGIIAKVSLGFWRVLMIAPSITDTRYYLT